MLNTPLLHTQQVGSLQSGDFLVDGSPLPRTFAQAFVVTRLCGDSAQARSVTDNQSHTFNIETGTSTTIPGLVVRVEKRLSGWIDEDHCSLRCIQGTDPAHIASRVAFIEKTPRVRKAGFTNEREDYQVWEEGPKGCAPEYGRHEPSRDWCNHRLVDLGYELPEGVPEGYKPPVPVSQLDTYLAASGGKIVIAGKAYRIDNIRNETGLGFFADVHAPRAKYLGMQVAGKVAGKPGAEAWDVLRMSGRGSVVLSFAVHKGAVFRLSH